HLPTFILVVFISGLLLDSCPSSARKMYAASAAHFFGLPYGIDSPRTAIPTPAIPEIEKPRIAKVQSRRPALLGRAFALVSIGFASEGVMRNAGPRSHVPKGNLNNARTSIHG